MISLLANILLSNTHQYKEHYKKIEMPLHEFEGKRPVIPNSTFIYPDAVVIGSVELGEVFSWRGCRYLRRFRKDRYR